MLEKAEYTMSRFARMYGMDYVGMATNNREAETLAKNVREVCMDEGKRTISGITPARRKC